MKKHLLTALAFLGIAMLSSCVQEKSFDGKQMGENDVAFVMQNTSTRSAEAASSVTKGVTLKMGTTPQGEPLILEETIENLNPGPATRGIPAYTENVGVLYETMGVYSPTTSFGDASFAVMDQYEHPADPTIDGWRYHHRYNSSPWPADKNALVDFYLRMPATGTGVEAFQHLYTNNQVSFNLASPEQARNQQDLLFGFTSISNNKHDSYLPAGAPVTMYHALSGVKFANGHDNGNQTKTIISKVEFTGLVDNGTCTITFDKNGNPPTIVWTNPGISTVGTGEDTALFTFSETFNNPTYTPDSGASNSDGTVDYTNSSDPNYNPALYGTSWTAAAGSHNLNDKDGSLTFWFIPQTITEDVILNVTFCIKTPETPNGTEIVRSIEFGKLVNEGRENAVYWDAGQLRTYTLKPYDVDVVIMDNMTSTIKSDLRIVNTGNVDEYVRVLIMGNWYGWKPGTTPTEMQTTEPSILVGYKYKGDEPGLTEAQKSEMVDPWYREGYPDPENPSTYKDPYGHFDSSFTLAKLGERDGQRNDWADASGGFYYTMPIGPGEKIEGTGSATKDLFKTYEVTEVPDIYLPSGNGRAKAEGVHLVMEIVVQAIEVPTKMVDGEEKQVWWLEAWYQATGVSKLHPNSMKDGEYRNKTYRDHFIAGDYAPTVSGEITVE